MRFSSTALSRAGVLLFAAILTIGVPQALEGQERVRRVRPAPDVVPQADGYIGVYPVGTFQSLHLLVHNKGNRNTGECVRVKVIMPSQISSISHVTANFVRFLCNAGQSCQVSNVDAVCDMKALAPNETVGLEVRFRAREPGGASIRVELDPDNTIRESNERNNLLILPLAVHR